MTELASSKSSSLPPLARIPSQIAAVADYEPFARDRMSAEAWAYMAGGAADELTLRWNQEAYGCLRLTGRPLNDLSNGDTKVTLFGHTFDFPILLAPIAYHRLAHPDGELATALGASAIRAGFVVSTKSNLMLEDIARTARTPLWFQLYLQQDREITLDLVQRAQSAGYRALVVTVDAPVSGVRNTEQRANFRLPAGMEAVNLQGAEPPGTHVVAGVNTVFGPFLDRAPTWKDIEWLRSQTRLPLILKGITAPQDALRAVAEGADGIIVSNHGGRTLDTLPPTIEILPRIAQAIEGRATLLMDGGIRRGTDIVKALALGAQAVLIGRPYIYGLAAAGASGVAHVVHILRTELEVAMALTGCRTLSAITEDVLWDKPRVD